MSGKDTVSARVPKDTSKRFERYRSERELSKSEAGKRLIERGLDRETGELPADATDEKPVADVFRDMGLAALLFTILATLWTTPVWGVIALGAVGVVLLAASVASRLYLWRAGQ